MIDIVVCPAYVNKKCYPLTNSEFFQLTTCDTESKRHQNVILFVNQGAERKKTQEIFTQWLLLCK